MDLLKRSLVGTAAALALTFTSTPARGDLIINLDFSNFGTGAPSDGSAILGTGTLAQAQTVIETAANYWMNAFVGASSSIGWATAGNITQNIDVIWEAKGGSTLATGGPTWNGAGALIGGELAWDNDGSSEFYVDTAPMDNAEFQKSSERNETLGVSINVERTHYDPVVGNLRGPNNPVAASFLRNDMLTVALHELGHALGVVDGFPAYSAEVGDNDHDITSGPFNGAAIPVGGAGGVGHTNFTITTPDANGHYPYEPGGMASFAVPPDPTAVYNPTNLGPSIQSGTRKLLSAADIAIVAQLHQFDMSAVNFNPGPTAVPEPSSLLLGGVIGLFLFRRRRGGSRSA